MAHQLKNQKKIAQVFTDDGLVKIKLIRGKQETAHVIRNVTEIETIVARYESQAPAQNNTLTRMQSLNTDSSAVASTHGDDHQQQQLHQQLPPQQLVNATGSIIEHHAPMTTPQLNTADIMTLPKPMETESTHTASSTLPKPNT